MTDKNNSRETHTCWFRHPTRGQIQAVLFTIALITSIAVMPLMGGLDSGTAAAATTDSNTSYYDDFENGTTDEWEIDDGSNVSVSDKSFYGNHSALLNDTDISTSSERGAMWESGNRFDMGNNFEITGTYNVTPPDDTSSYRSRLGIISDDHNNMATITMSWEYDATYLTTDPGQDPGGDYITGVTDNTWMNFRYQVDGGDARAKVWEAGTDQPDSWQMKRSFDEFEGRFFFTTGWADANRTMYLDEVDAGGNAITGQVVDQNGEPVPNATVEGMGVNSESINDSIDDKEAEAERLLEEAEGALSDEWDPDVSVTGEGGISGTAEEAGVNYVGVHTRGDWDLNAKSSWKTKLFAADEVSPELGAPDVQTDNSQLVLSLWDPSATRCGTYTNRCDEIDEDMPGRSTGGKIVVKKHSPTGEHLDTQTYETQDFAELNPSWSFDAKTHENVRVYLSEGHFYEVHPEGEPESSYLIAVGNPTDWEDQVVHDLETEAQQLTERAESIRTNMETGLFERRTTTTDKNGYYTLRMQTGVQKATVQAYRADGTILPAMTGPSFSDLRDTADGDYNGTFHVGPPVKHDVPKENVTLETYRTDELPYQGISSLNEFKDWVRDQRLNETIEELQSEYDQRFDEMNRSALERVYTSHKTLTESVSGAEDRYLDRSDFESIQDPGDLSDEELATETGHMQTALSGVDSVEPPDVGDDPITIEDGKLHAEYGPIPDGIDPDTIQPEIHWSDGTSTEIPEEYWSIESAGTFRTNSKLVVDGYPIDETDPAAFDLRVFGGGEGGILDDRLSALNPSFSGNIPDVSAIDVSTLSPGKAEHVSMTVRADGDSNYGGIQSAEVFGPAGQQLPTGISGDKASFTANGAGKHFVRLTVTDTTGGQFVHSFQIRALDQGRSDPPTVRAETATGDRVFALAGDGLEDASIESDHGTLEVDAVLPGGEIPGSIHIKPQAAMDYTATSIDVNVLEGTDEATVSSNIETVIHLDALTEDAVSWRGEASAWTGQPIGWGGGTRYGSITDRSTEDTEKYIIRTYTDGDGSVSVTLNQDPGWVASQQHSIATTVPRVTIPSLPGMTVPAAGGTTVAGLLGLFARRRRRGAG